MTTVSLGGIDLNPAILWTERYFTPTTGLSQKWTLGGKVIMRALHKNERKITLVATQEQGWLTKAQVDALQVLAADPLGQYTFVFDTDSMLVTFRHDEAPAIEFTPIVSRPNQESTDYLIGSIKLRLVY